MPGHVRGADDTAAVAAAAARATRSTKQRRASQQAMKRTILVHVIHWQ